MLLFVISFNYLSIVKINAKTIIQMEHCMKLKNIILVMSAAMKKIVTSVGLLCTSCIALCQAFFRRVGVMFLGATRGAGTRVLSGSKKFFVILAQVIKDVGIFIKRLGTRAVHTVTHGITKIISMVGLLFVSSIALCRAFFSRVGVMFLGATRGAGTRVLSGSKKFFVILAQVIKDVGIFIKRLGTGVAHTVTHGVTKIISMVGLLFVSSIALCRAFFRRVGVMFLGATRSAGTRVLSGSKNFASSMTNVRAYAENVTKKAGHRVLLHCKDGVMALQEMGTKSLNTTRGIGQNVVHNSKKIASTIKHVGVSADNATKMVYSQCKGRYNGYLSGIKKQKYTAGFLIILAGAAYLSFYYHNMMVSHPQKMLLTQRNDIKKIEPDVLIEKAVIEKKLVALEKNIAGVYDVSLSRANELAVEKAAMEKKLVALEKNIAGMHKGSLSRAKELAAEKAAMEKKLVALEKNIAGMHKGGLDRAKELAVEKTAMKKKLEMLGKNIANLHEDNASRAQELVAQKTAMSKQLSMLERNIASLHDGSLLRAKELTDQKAAMEKKLVVLEKNIAGIHEGSLHRAKELDVEKITVGEKLVELENRIVGVQEGDLKKVRGLFTEKLTAAEQKLANVEKRMSVEHENRIAKLQMQFSEKITATEQKFVALEKKIDELAKQNEATKMSLVNEKIKNEVDRQMILIQQHKNLHVKRKKTLTKLLDQLADDTNEED